MYSELNRRFIAHFTFTSEMDRHVLSAVIVLLLLVAVQAHTRSHEDTSSSSSEATSLIVDSSASRTTVNAGDPPPAFPRPRDARFKSSSSSHESIIIEELHATLLLRNIEVPAPSSASNIKSTTDSAIAAFSSLSLPELLSSGSDTGSSIAEFDVLDCTAVSDSGSSSRIDERNIAGEADSVEPSRSNSDRVSITITTQVVYVFSRSDDDASQSAASSYSAGTVQPNNERTEVESAAIEFSAVESTTPDQVDDDVDTSSPSTSTTPAFGKKATSTDIGSTNHDQDGRTGDLTTSDSTLSSPIFYACVVLGVVGLVGAVVASRAKGKRYVSDKWRVTTEASSVTPPMVHPSAWAPAASEVHVIIDDHRFALL